MKAYTKSDLEELVFSQLACINAMHALVYDLKHQNKLMQLANEKLLKKLAGIKKGRG